jgi:parvulin-like peptidyl-prolyl isomerase
MNRDNQGRLVALMIGLILGWLGVVAWQHRGALISPSAWLARVGDGYITRAMFIDEMHRRGGATPGQYQDMAQKRALLDDMVWKMVQVNSANAQQLAQAPEVRHQIDQILASHYQQRTLRKQQQAIVVTDADVRAHYDAHVADYIVPARRRLAMVQILVPAGASEEVWKNAMERGAEVLAKARAQAAATPHFGVVAREYSQDQASRYRGGMIGWIAEGKVDRYRYDPALLTALLALKSAGEFSAVVRGKDAVYVGRVVELEAQRERPFEQLAIGIRQGLLQERMQQAETQFRERLLKASAITIHQAELESIDPLAPPADSQPPQPPAMPNQ